MTNKYIMSTMRNSAIIFHNDNRLLQESHRRLGSKTLSSSGYLGGYVAHTSAKEIGIAHDSFGREYTGTAATEEVV
jgi:hypothetical protein